jgi:hypothetical protein
MSIRCGYCDNEVDACGYCGNSFKDKSEIICEDYGEIHFCSNDCFHNEHETKIDNCYEQKDD